MKIKSYFSPTVEDAMALARQELGADAMLVNSRPASLEARHLGAYEVVFASETGAAESHREGSPAPAPVANDRLSQDVAELKRELENMRRALAHSALPPAPWAGTPPDLSEAYRLLTANEVDPFLAREIVNAAESRASAGRTSPPERGIFERILTEEIENRVKVEPALGIGEGRPRIVALVGPPGAGKTTTLVKLAVNYGLACRRPAMLLSADTHRVAAAEQLRSYAAILGVAFQVLETVSGLAQAIEEHRGKELILIDTPGLSSGEMDESADLARFLSTRPDIDTQLVVSASMKPADLSRAVAAFAAFAPERLLFTKLDETGSFGPILNEACRTGKALSFFTTGQRIPEDLEEASRRRVAGLILNGRREAASAA